MAYRGEDLDLRTPQTWSGAPEPAGGADPYLNGARGRQGSYTRTSPILVDDVVLSCSNHAFDVAVAHRAGEVRLEHLLHAMTRIDGASNALEARGIRVAGLRRESATIIASEIPIGLSGQGRPRRSDDIEQVLRTASAIAYRRNSPANVDDVLDALLDMPSDIPGIALLARHGGRVARDRLAPRETVRDRDTLPPLQPLPPLSRTSQAYTPLSDARIKPSAAYYTPEPQRVPRTDLVGTPTDGIQNARIDQLETAVRAMTAELANERNAVAGVVQDLQRNLKAERDDTSRFRGGLHERLQSLEQTMISSGNDGSANMLLDRLASLERGLEARLGDLSRPWSVLSDRLQALEQTILDTRGKSGDSSAVQERLAMIERSLRDGNVEGSRAAASVIDRLKSVERGLDSVNSKSIDLTPIAHRLDIIEEAVLGADTGAGSDKLAERFSRLEDAINTQRAAVQQANAALNNDIKALASALAMQSAGNERVQSFITDRMQTLTSGFERQRTELAGPITERMNAIASALDGRMQTVAGLIDRQRSEMTGPVVERMNAIAGAIESRGGEQQRTIAMLNERIAMLEKQLAASVQATAEAQAAHAAELKEVHEALIKLNTNQHTLAGSIDQWRLDGVGDISIIANRLENIETSAAKPVEMMAALTTSVDNINRATVERYHRRNRFWYWLFGTDDWLTASWPSQVASVEAERAVLRGSVPKAGPMAVPGKPVQRA
jgi:hypothetical protein